MFASVFQRASAIRAAARFFVAAAGVTLTAARTGVAQDTAQQFMQRGPRFLLASADRSEPARVDLGRTPVLRHRLTIDYESITLGEALKRVASSSGLELAYSNAIIPIDSVVHLKAQDITVAAALTELLIYCNVDVLFSPSGQAVLIRQRDAAPKPVPVPGVITGRVTEGTGTTPVSGVTVVVQGTGLNAQTGEDGRYTIRGVQPGTYTIEARRLGFAPVTRNGVVVPDGGTATVNIAIQVAVLHLQETVVTGVVDPTAGTKVPFTVGRVTKEDLPVPATNPIADIQGKIAGVAMVPPAQPGSDVSIQLRTPSSINKSNAPLIVVDGVILGPNSVDINSLDIESIEVVKGAAGASLYGSRAASGVIQIRTTRGNALAAGQTQFTVRSEIGSSSLGNEVAWANHHFYLTNANGQYVDTLGAIVPREKRVQRPAAARFQDQNYIVPLFDPVEQFFNPGNLITNSFTVAQNGQRTNFLTTASRQRQDGVVLGHGGYTRTDARINLDHRPRDDMQISISGYHARSDRDELPSDPFYNLINIAPDVNLLTPDPDGTKYAFQPDLVGVNANPLYSLETQKATTQRIRTLGSASVRYTPTGWLTLDASGSYDRADQNGSSWIDRGVKTSTFPTGGLGSLTLSNLYTSAINAEASASLLKELGAFTGRMTFRALVEEQKALADTATGTDFAVAGIPRLNAARVRGSSSAETDFGSQGYFLTTGVDYSGRLIFDALVRRDASSLFGPGEQWHTYYRGSAAWRIAQEPWWKWQRVNEFKLRVSQGTAGTRPSFADQFETYTVNANGTVSKAALGNRFLKPETARETEVGLDIIVDNKYSLQISHADTRTTDALVQIPLPGAVGFTTQWQNAGTMVGNTWEATFQAEMFRRGSTAWRLGLIADRSRNHIAEFNRSCVRTADISYRCTGEDLSTMYGRKFVRSTGELPASQANAQGVFEVNDDGLLVAVGQGGHYTDAGKWGTSVVSNGVTYPWGMPIVRLDSAGQGAVMRIGSGNPRFHYGVTNTFDWKGFQLYGLIDTQLGGNIYNATNQRMYQYQRSADVDQSDKPTELKKPIDYYTLLYDGNNVNEWFVEPGGFVKLREVSLRYRLPARWLSRFPASRAAGATVSLVGRNLMTWTRYSGYDP
ncbi:MAG TPA: SusC/RagA family TonB-linked outer membrane protein, partial [Gemmatimonadaceae bacterium]